MFEDGCDFVDGASFGLWHLEPREEDEEEQQHNEDDKHEWSNQLLWEEKENGEWVSQLTGDFYLYFFDLLE